MTTVVTPIASFSATESVKGTSHGGPFVSPIYHEELQRPIAAGPEMMHNTLSPEPGRRTTQASSRTPLFYSVEESPSPSSETRRAQGSRSSHFFFAAPSTSVLSRFVYRSSLIAPFMVESVARDVVVLPPPIYRLYQHLGRTQSALYPRAESVWSDGAGSSSGKTVLATSATDMGPLVRCDTYSFLWSLREFNSFRLQQREYLARQHRSPYAPLLVQADALAANLLNDSELEAEEARDEMASSATPSSTPQATTKSKSRWVDLLSGLFTHGIPQVEYLQSVFEYRLSVLQKRLCRIPTGVVVPTVVQAAAPTPDRRFTSVPLQVTARKGSQSGMRGAAGSHIDVAAVSFPHPGVPLTYLELIQNPILRTADQRAECRAALLHRRTSSEEVYGEPVPYTPR